MNPKDGGGGGIRTHVAARTAKSISSRPRYGHFGTPPRGRRLLYRKRTRDNRDVPEISPEAPRVRRLEDRRTRSLHGRLRLRLFPHPPDHPRAPPPFGH